MDSKPEPREQLPRIAPAALVGKVVESVEHFDEHDALGGGWLVVIFTDGARLYGDDPACYRGGS